MVFGRNDPIGASAHTYCLIYFLKNKVEDMSLDLSRRSMRLNVGNDKTYFRKIMLIRRAR